LANPIREVQLAQTAADYVGEFERDKWKAEQEFRERELALKAREQDTRDQEVALKRKEQTVSRWNTPLLLALIGAIVAGITNIGVAAYNGIVEHRSDTEKSDSATILQMIKTGDLKRATQNLQFLVDTGLVIDADRVKRIKEYLVAHPDDGPVLPASGERYSIDSDRPLPKPVRELLDSGLRDYTRHFDSLGFTKPETEIPISIKDTANMRSGWLSYYDEQTKAITVNRSVSGDLDFPRREYTHFILLKDQQNLDLNQPRIYLLESDLADYFVASFANQARIYHVSGPPNERSLDKKITFDASMNATEAWKQGREVWGSAFWAIRESLKPHPEVADRILATAWRKFHAYKGQDAISQFLIALKDAALSDGSLETQARVVSVLSERKFPLAGGEAH
jgi:hypothetical protein